jgi:hypothetical protein
VKETARSISSAKHSWLYRNIRYSPGSGPAVGASYHLYMFYAPPPLSPLLFSALNLRRLVFG